MFDDPGKPDTVIRWRRVIPANTLAFYSAMFACGLCEAAYVVWWCGDWGVSLMAASATAMILVPLFIGREFRNVAYLEREMAIDLRAQMIAGNERIRLAIEQSDQRMLEFQESFIEEQRRLRSENELLWEKYLPFAPNARGRGEDGKFVSGKPKQIGLGRKSRRVIACEHTETVIALPSSDHASKHEGSDFQ